MKSITRLLYMLCTVLLVSACNQDEELTTDISLSTVSYTFNCQTSEVLEVRVTCAETWNFEPSEEWIVAEKAGEEQLNITVRNNKQNELRKGEIVISAGNARTAIAIEQLGKAFRGKLVDLTNYANAVMSRNGKYVAGTTSQYDDFGNLVTQVFLTNTQTNETVEVKGIDKDFDTVSAVSDDGNILILYHSSKLYSFVWENNSTYEAEVPEGFSQARIEAISADGKVMVGYSQNTSTRKYVPLKWENRTVIQLELPENNAIGQPLNNGAMARGCSADGSVIYGSEWDIRGLIYWKDNTMHFLGDYALEEGIGVITKSAEPTSISPNGKYLAAVFETETGAGHPVKINTETGEVKILKEQCPDGAFITADNNGFYFGGTPSKGSSYGMVSTTADDIVSIDEWFEQTFGIALSNDRIIWQTDDCGKVYFGNKVVPTLLGIRYQPFYIVME